MSGLYPKAWVEATATSRASRAAVGNLLFMVQAFVNDFDGM